VGGQNTIRLNPSVKPGPGCTFAGTVLAEVDIDVGLLAALLRRNGESESFQIATCPQKSRYTCPALRPGPLQPVSFMAMAEESQKRGEVTLLLARAQQGDNAATDDLFPLVYEELRELAQRFLAGERKNHTLQPTALVHEAYMRLVGPDVAWDSRAHFFGAAARAIRRILTDHARGKDRLKRGGGVRPVSLEDVDLVAGDVRDVDLVGLDAALTALAELDSQKGKVVELRFFGGLTVEQTAAALGVSPSTVARDWAFSKVWLHRELSKAGE
jgi:RNA polymerase sigma-70 factor, ECF subfamily